MKSFQAICLQFCVTLSAPFLTCHKNVAHSNTHIQTQANFDCSHTRNAAREQLSSIPADPTGLPIQEQVGHPARCHADKWRCLTYANFSIGLATFPTPPLVLPYSILRLFLSKTFFVCQFQERFPLSVIKCSVVVINLFRSIVDGATKLKCIDIEKLIIKKRDEEEWQNWHKERQYLALAFLLYAKFYRIVNAEIKYFRKK